MSNRRVSFVGLLTVLLAAPVHAAPLRGYHKRVGVSAPTRLDWTFALANQSLAEPPADWLPDYDSTQQAYELFVPANYDAKRSYPVIVFISPSAEPMGWLAWEPSCKQLGVIFAGAHGAGNDCPPKKRARIVLDVLDDVRRKYHTDADRTYLTGMSGGGRVACGIAFALPEYFGGVVPICAGGELRSESWLRHRLIDRLSVALLTGETDFNRGEVERLRGPMLKDVGVRAKVWVYPTLGHGMPTGAQLQEVLRWLEAGVKTRKEHANRYPAIRLAGREPPSTREEWSQALLDEAKQRLKAKATLYTGLMQLQGCTNRWKGLPAAEEAKKILEEYDARDDRPWEADDLAEQRRFLIAEARALDAYGSGPLPPQYVKMRSAMVQQAIRLWEIILKDGADTPAGKEAQKRIPQLQKLLQEP
jgi:hypothetical protein